MSDNKRHYSSKFIALLGFSTLAVLLVLSYYFYRERIYFSDPAFQLFLLINDEHIAVMTNRWPSTIFRALPFIGLKIQASVATIAQLFSISFPLYQLICFCLLLFVIKNRVYALLAILLLVLGTTESFYWCSSDLLQGILLMLIGVAIYKNETWPTWSRYLFSLFFLTATVFFHPLCLFPFFFIVVDDILDQRKIKAKDLLLLGAFGVLWLIRSKVFENFYDRTKSGQFADNLKKFQLWDIPTHKVFLLQEVPVFYQLVVLVGIVSIIILIKNKQYLRVLFLMASCLVMITVVHIANPKSVFHFYREASYVPLSIFVSYPFVKHILKLEVIQFKYQLFVGLLVVFSLIRIFSFGDNYKNRTQLLEQKLSEADCNKSLWKVPQEATEILKMNWGIPFETALLASEKGKTMTIFNPKRNKDYLVRERKDVFIGPWKLLFTDDLNKNYFDFKDADYCELK